MANPSTDTINDTVKFTVRRLSDTTCRDIPPEAYREIWLQPLKGGPFDTEQIEWGDMYGYMKGMHCLQYSQVARDVGHYTTHSLSATDMGREQKDRVDEHKGVRRRTMSKSAPVIMHNTHTSERECHSSASTSHSHSEGEEVNIRTERKGGKRRASWQSAVGPSLRPGCVRSETDREYVLRLELPGTERRDVCVTVSPGRVLTVQVKENSGDMPSVEVNSRTYYYRPVPQLSCRHSVKLPDDADRTRVSATLVEGVLRVVIPKADETHVVVVE
ncbi:hypothetical protein KIPB_006436 [Kipferlia bialata]|uniref:SHSP domain-containing protein n=1 Tax=Kipferlia bialata TaxID=797122 RepID=A0A9K3CYL7_9EUKA|nr:hypothetical protein KIPB_006436 [Kipferlia bialata]|eukprot:g6436.t1